MCSDVIIRQTLLITWKLNMSLSAVVHIDLQEYIFSFILTYLQFH